MFVPKIYLKHINPYSGHLDPQCKYGNFNSHSLFLQPCNVEYLGNLTMILITNKKYVKSIGGDISLVHDFKKFGKSIKLNVMDLVEEFEFPRRSTLLTNNPIQQLSMINRDFSIKTAKEFISNFTLSCPQMYDKYHNRNNITGKKEDCLYAQYTAKSYADGVWRPEDLFLNTPLAKDNAWKVREVYAEDPKRRWGSNHSGIPFWNRTPQNRHYDRTNDEGLVEGGRSDRRLQIPRGYGIYHEELANNSTYYNDVSLDDLRDERLRLPFP